MALLASGVFASPNDPPPAAYTNRVGHVILGRPLSIEAEGVRFVGADGAERRLPLSAFPDRERRRLCAAAGVPELSPALSRRLSLYREHLRRLELHRGLGRVTAEEAAERSAAIRAAWRKTLETCPDLLPEERAFADHALEGSSKKEHAERVE